MAALPYCVLGYYSFEGTPPARKTDLVWSLEELSRELQSCVTDFFQRHPNRGFFVDLYSPNANLLRVGVSSKGYYLGERRTGSRLVDVEVPCDKANVSVMEDEAIVFLNPEWTELLRQYLLPETIAGEYVLKWLERENSNQTISGRFSDIVTSSEPVVFASDVRATVEFFVSHFQARELFHYLDFTSDNAYLYARISGPLFSVFLSSHKGFLLSDTECPGPMMRFFTSDFDIGFYYGLVQGARIVKEKSLTAWGETECVFFGKEGFSWTLTKTAEKEVPQDELDRDSNALRDVVGIGHGVDVTSLGDFRGKLFEK